MPIVRTEFCSPHHPDTRAAAVVPRAAAGAVAAVAWMRSRALSPPVVGMLAAVAVAVAVDVDSRTDRAGRRSPAVGGGGLGQEPGKYRRMTFED